MRGLARQMADEGLEAIGTIEVSGVLVVGDPAVIGRNPANGAYHALRTRQGTWHLFLRPEADDADTIAEIVAIHEEALPKFFEIYDDAAPVLEIAAPSGRICLLDGPLKDDLELRGALLEPDLDALPWVTDRGVVVASQTGHPARIFHGSETPIEHVSVAFGPVPWQVAGAPMTIDG